MVRLEFSIPKNIYMAIEIHLLKERYIPLKYLNDKKYYKPIVHIIRHNTQAGAIIQQELKLITRDDLVQIHLYKGSYVSKSKFKFNTALDNGSRII